MELYLKKRLRRATSVRTVLPKRNVALTRMRNFAQDLKSLIKELEATVAMPLNYSLYVLYQRGEHVFTPNGFVLEQVCFML